MSTRKSTRAKPPVKYTSDSEGSEFGTTPMKASRTPKKTLKRAADKPAPATTPTPKRRKRDAETLAAEAREKASQAELKASKASHKHGWEAWQKAHDVGGEVLDEEPAREDSITQTDAQKKYGLKPSELGSLRHFEKKHHMYGNTTKLFVEEEVRVLGWRKAGMLDGEVGEGEVLGRGEEIWREEHKHDAEEAARKGKVEEKEDKPKKTKTKTKTNTPKQNWTVYISTHALAENDTLAQEPEDAINQTDSKTKFNLTPQDLACIPYFPKKNPMYGNTMKLFKQSEVKALAYRKAAVLAGVEGDDEMEVLRKGKEILERTEEEKE